MTKNSEDVLTGLTANIVTAFRSLVREFQEFSEMGQIQAERFLVAPSLKARITIRIESDDYSEVNDENL